jgi:hypothetical protein
VLKNYRSDMPINRIFEGITTMLVAHGARQIADDYSVDGNVVGLGFTIETPRSVLPIKLPANRAVMLRAGPRSGPT